MGDKVLGKGIELHGGPAAEIKQRERLLHGTDYLGDRLGIKTDRFPMTTVPASSVESVKVDMFDLPLQAQPFP